MMGGASRIHPDRSPGAIVIDRSDGATARGCIRSENIGFGRWEYTRRCDSDSLCLSDSDWVGICANDCNNLAMEAS
jgi:hypothetical protein